MRSFDEKMMALALKEAARGWGTTSPNPMVGAVIVKDGAVIAKGFHARAGGPHAEIEALARAGHAARGADVYVTLEPCNHFGRTGPCAKALIEAGVRRVVLAQRDPHPLAAGGAEALAAAGIEVVEGVLETRARKQNEFFNKFAVTGRPFVILKSAATLDGKLAAKTGHARWVTGEKSRAFVHRLRAGVDAILVGRGTVLRDDPTLNVRVPGRKPGRDPVRIVLDTLLKSDPEARIFNRELGGPTIAVCGPDPDPERKARLEERGTRVWSLPLAGNVPDLNLLLDRLGREEITSLLIEGGGEVNASALLDQRIVDKILFFFAPKIVGGRQAPTLADGEGLDRMDQALPVQIRRLRRFGPDLLIEAVPETPTEEK